MITKKNAPVLIILSLFFLCFGYEKNKDDIVSLKIISPENGFERSKLAFLSLEIEIKKPYHINSEKPDEDYLIPTSLSFNENDEIKVNKVNFPKPSIKKFSFSESPLSIYEGTIIVTAEITISCCYSKDEAVVSGVFFYQACDNEICLAPSKLPFEFKIKIKN